MTDIDRVKRVIRARCSDAIATSDIDLIEAALTGGDAIAEVLERVVDVVDAIATRLDALEEAA